MNHAHQRLFIKMNNVSRHWSGRSLIGHAARPIVNQPQLSITTFHCVFIPISEEWKLIRRMNNWTKAHMTCTLIWSMSRLLTWGKQDLCTLHTATRGRSSFGKNRLTFTKESVGLWGKLDFHRLWTEDPFCMCSVVTLQPFTCKSSMTTTCSSTTGHSLPGPCFPH